MDLVLLGSGAFALPTFRALASSHRIVAVVTQPDKPAGRGKRLTPTPVASWVAEELPRAPLLKPPDVNDPDVVARVRSLRADAWVVIAFAQKLSPPLLQGVFAINLHASLLPRWRGAAPINAAILAGDARTGNSVIAIADRMDAGDIYARSRRPITPDLTAGDLHDLLAADGPPPVLRTLQDLDRDTLYPTPQDDALATRAPRLSRRDAWVDFTDDADACRRRVHALTPWPGVAVTFRDKRLKLLRVQALPAHSEQPAEDPPPGALIDAKLGLVACRPHSALRLIEVQLEGRKPMSWADFARGHNPKEGELLAGGKPC